MCLKKSMWGSVGSLLYVKSVRSVRSLLYVIKNRLS